MEKQKKQKMSVKVTCQTAYNLGRLATMYGYAAPGQVVDELVREQMLRIRAKKGKKAAVGAQNTRKVVDT